MVTTLDLECPEHGKEEGRAPSRQECPMTLIGQSIAALDTPALLLDLDRVDANLAHLQAACRAAGKDLRVHFKSLKCGSLAKYLAARGVRAFLCAKLNEAETLVGAGIRDVYVANQVVGPAKLALA